MKTVPLQEQERTRQRQGQESAERLSISAEEGGRTAVALEDWRRQSREEVALVNTEGAEDEAGGENEGGEEEEAAEVA